MKILLMLCFLPIAFGAKSDAEMLMENEKNNIEIFKKNSDSVVNVTIESKVRRGIPFFFGYERNNEELEKVGMGSGFVWDSNGHIITNSHVVYGGDNFVITFQNDKKQYKAKLVGKDVHHDLAVLKLLEKPKELYPVKPGSSSNLQVGQKAVAIGNPMGFDHTMTVGIISAVNREIAGFGQVSLRRVIQTDAAINLGNSGGPLFDSSGKLIGVNTMIVSPSGSSSGLGFAIPVDTVKEIVPELIKHGKIIRPALGVGIAENPYGEEGLIITHVAPGSGAAKAGIKGIIQDRRGRVYMGDLLLEVNGKKIESFDDLFHLLGDYKVGDDVSVLILREGQKKTIKVKLMPLDSSD
jgi:S1-C subfamily serine protease